MMLWIPRIDSTIRFFLYVLIFWLPYSPAVVESCVIPAFILWIVKKVLQLRFRSATQFIAIFPPTPVNLPIFFFLFVCLLSIGGSLWFGMSLKGFFTKTLEWFVVFYLILETFTERRHITIALGILTVTALSTSMNGLIQYYWTHRDLFLGHEIAAGDRATASFKTPNGLGAYLALAIPAIIGFSLAQEKRFKYYMAVLALVLAWCLAVSGSRGALLGFVIGLGFFVCLSFVKKKFKFAYIG